MVECTLEMHRGGAQDNGRYRREYRRGVSLEFLGSKT